eukprot:g6459.t1
MLQVEQVFCSEEADQEIALACAIESSPGSVVYGKDSDFLLFRDCRYVEFGSFSVEGKSLNAIVLSRCRIAQILGCEEEALVELAIYKGNDFTKHFGKDSFLLDRDEDSEVFVGLNRNDNFTLLEIFGENKLVGSPEYSPEIDVAIEFSRKLYNLDSLEDFPYDDDGGGNKERAREINQELMQCSSEAYRECVDSVELTKIYAGKDVGEDFVGLRMGHGVRDESPGTRIWFCTAGYLVRIAAHHPETFHNHSHLIIDEIHERSVDTDLLCYLVRGILEKCPQLRVILMSATLAADTYCAYFNLNSKPLFVGQRRCKLTEFFLEDVAQDKDKLLMLSKGQVRKAKEIIVSMDNGRCTPSSRLTEKQCALAFGMARALGTPGKSVLIFVEGIMAIQTIMLFFDNLEGRSRKQYNVIPIHSDIPFEEQMKAFEKDPTKVKIVVATNAASSSITLTDCDNVICMGTEKRVEYNIRRHQNVITPPAREQFKPAFDSLHSMQFFDAPGDDGAITAQGKIAVELGIDLQLSKLVIYGIMLGVSREAACIAAALSMDKLPFRVATSFFHEGEELNQIIATTLLSQNEFDDGHYSIPIMMLRLLIWGREKHRTNSELAYFGIVRSRFSTYMKTAQHIENQLSERHIVRVLQDNFAGDFHLQNNSLKKFMIIYQKCDIVQMRDDASGAFHALLLQHSSDLKMCMLRDNAKGVAYVCRTEAIGKESTPYLHLVQESAAKA